MPKNWNRRFKHNRDKMKTGDIFELAEVVRNLVAARPREGPLDGREADVRQGEEDPRLRADVREGHGRGGVLRVARGRALGRRRRQRQGEDRQEGQAGREGHGLEIFRGAGPMPAPVESRHVRLGRSRGGRAG